MPFQLLLTLPPTIVAWKGRELPVQSIFLVDLAMTGPLITEEYGDHRKLESVSMRVDRTDVLTVALTLVYVRERN